VTCDPIDREADDKLDRQADGPVRRCRGE